MTGIPGFAEIRFKGTRKDYFTYEPMDLAPGAHVIVEADRGEDLGEVSAIGVIAQRKCSSSGKCSTPTPEKRIVRAARPDDIRRVESLRDDERRVCTETRKLVDKHRLKMKVTEAEWQFDRNKLMIYFTAERRVRFPRARARPGPHLPYSDRTQTDRSAGRGCTAGWGGSLRTRVMLLHLAP